jgi:HTH-type transcriptional regulator/antitoxin MqsA
MQYERRADILVYKGQERSCRTLAWWCTQCGEAIFAGKPLLARDRAFQQLKADVDQVLGPDEVAQVREKLRLSQRRAGEVLGGGPRAFQKYESGKQAVSVPMSNLLRLLARDPSRLREIASGHPRSQARHAGRRAA